MWWLITKGKISAVSRAVSETMINMNAQLYIRDNKLYDGICSFLVKIDISINLYLIIVLQASHCSMKTEYGIWFT